jgi:hypothetical protein
VSLRNRRFILRVGQAEVVLWGGGASNYQLAQQTIDNSNGLLVADVAVRVTSALAVITSAFGAEFARSRVEVVVDESLCPGLVVDLGEQALPARIRQSFLRSRFIGLAGESADDWEVRIDPSRISGLALAFGMSAAVRMTIEDMLLRLRVRSISIQPIFVWCWNRASTARFTGMFASGSNREIAMAYFRDGRPVSFENVDRDPVTIDWAIELQRQVLVHGISDSKNVIRVVGFPDFILPPSQDNEKLKLESLVAFGPNT